MEHLTWFNKMTILLYSPTKISAINNSSKGGGNVIHRYVLSYLTATSSYKITAVLRCPTGSACPVLRTSLSDCSFRRPKNNYLIH